MELGRWPPLAIEIRQRPFIVSAISGRYGFSSSTSHERRVVRMPAVFVSSHVNRHKPVY